MFVDLLAVNERLFENDPGLFISKSWIGILKDTTATTATINNKNSISTTTTTR